mgnify:CR=1 FL=1
MFSIIGTAGTIGTLGTGLSLYTAKGPRGLLRLEDRPELFNAAIDNIS